jgi:hypothetical protein
VLNRRRPRVVDDAELVRVTADLLAAEGPLAVTAPRLARALGFPEHQLHVLAIDAAVAGAYRGLDVAELADVRRMVLSDPSPVEQMRAVLNRLVTRPGHSDQIRLEAWALTRRNPGLMSAVQDGQAAWHRLVASVIRSGARSGHFLGADADDVAAHVLSLVDGINSFPPISYRSDFDRTRLLIRVVQSELGVVWGPEPAVAVA